MGRHLTAVEVSYREAASPRYVKKQTNFLFERDACARQAA